MNGNLSAPVKPNIIKIADHEQLFSIFELSPKMPSNFHLYNQTSTIGYPKSPIGE